MNILLVAFGAALLYAGGEVLVRNAVLLARATGVRPLTVGLTVVAFGTSAPELATTLAANLRGAPEAALGNVVGSNIANLGLVLGLAALLMPLRPEKRLLRREMPFAIVATALLFVLLADGVLGRAGSALPLALLAVYFVMQSGAARPGSRRMRGRRDAPGWPCSAWASARRSSWRAARPS